MAERSGGCQGEVVGQGIYVIDLHRPGRIEVAEVGDRDSAKCDLSLRSTL